jgi:branched-chain amino acid aminotransferase
MTGTAAQVTVVTQVDHRPVGSGVMGPVAARLRELYAQAVRGQLPRYRHWNTPIYAGSTPTQREPVAGKLTAAK